MLRDIARHHVVTPVKAIALRSWQPRIVFLGAGAIGGSVAAWLAESYPKVAVLDLGPQAEAIRERGITVYPQGRQDLAHPVRVTVLDSMDDLRKDDVVVVGVKNYSLHAVARELHARLGDAPVVVAMQNGVENQAILPKFFSKVIYCVISYNAWLDRPGVIGYQKKGPLHFGTLNRSLESRTVALARLFSQGVETEVSHRINDAAHCKLVINLTNSLTTLIGLNVRPIDDMDCFQQVLSNLCWEGVQIVRAAGVREVALGGMPSWKLLRLSALLPRKLTRRLFEKNVAKMVMSSMAQDVLQRGGNQSELESINGYLLSLADRHGLAVPYNRAVYALARHNFGREDFAPMDIRLVLKAVEAQMK